MRHNRSLWILAVVATATTAWLFAQPGETPSQVKITFDNTTTAAVDIYGVDSEGKEVLYAEGLPAARVVELAASPGNLWRIKIGKVALGEYETGESPNQVINLAELATWQLPVSIVFLNDSDAPVDLFLVNDEGEETLMVEGLRPGQQYLQAGANPGSDWEVRREKKVVAEYVADNDPDQEVPLKELIEDYASQVTVTFQNTTEAPVDLLWRSPDGSEELYAPDLPAGMQYVQRTLPDHIWIIRQKNVQLAMFIPSDLPKQVCNIKEVAAFVKKEEAALEKAKPTTPEGTNKPPKPGEGDKPPKPDEGTKPPRPN